MLSIIYSSTATRPFTADDLADLLQHSRASNEKHALTGLLMYRDGRFLQLLEGDDADVQERMAVIGRDSRHEHVRTLLEEHIEERQFPDWTMGFAHYDESAATRVTGYRTTFEDLAADQAGNTTTPALRELIRWFQDDPCRLN